MEDVRLGSGRRGDRPPGSVRVLHVDDNPDLTSVAAQLLEQQDESITVTSETDPGRALDRVRTERVDCIVSDYDMEGFDGVELLRAVREEFPDLPFILFTGKGSESVASEAISAGVTDYLRKGSGDQYPMLSKRILNAVSHRRTRRDLQRRIQQQEVVAELARVALEERDVEAVLDRAASEVAGALDVEHCMALKLHPETGELQPYAGTGNWDHVPACTEELAELVLQSGEPVVVGDGDPGAVETVHLVSGIGATVGDVGDPWGLVCANTADPREFSEEDLTFVRSVANLLGTALDRFEHERRLSTLVSNLPGMVYRCRNEPDWPMEFVGGQVESLTGYDPVALESWNVMWGEEIIHPDDQDWLWDEVQDALDAGDPFEVTYRITTRDGETKWVWEQGRGIYSMDGELEALEGFITDVTEKEKRERRLERERDRVAALFENAPAAIVYYEFEGDDPVARAVNPGFEDAFGFEAADVVGRNLDVIVVPQEDREETADLNRRLRTGEPVEKRVTRNTADGRRRFLLRCAPLRPGESGERGYAIYVDVTDREVYERTLESLHEATRRMVQANDPEEVCETTIEVARDVLDQTYATVFLYDEDRDVLQAPVAPDEAIELFGPPPTFDPGEGIVGHAYANGESLLLDDAQTDDRRHENPSDNIHGYCVVPMGSHGVLVVASPEKAAFDEADFDLARILAGNAEVALDRATRQQKLERQNERLDEFAAAVSHDLRNPLETAIGGVELARADRDDDYLERAATALDRMEGLVEGMLVLARADRDVDTDPVRLDPVVEAAWESLPDTEASLVQEDDLGRIAADRGHLRQLVENLLRNAVEHGSTGNRTGSGDAVEHGSTSNQSSTGDAVEHGSTGSRTGSDDAVEYGGGSVEVGRLEAPGGFYVADDGPGIPPERRDRIFESGYTTDESGVGFGLTIVGRVAEAHGWDVRVVESESGGARFEVLVDP